MTSAGLCYLLIFSYGSSRDCRDDVSGLAVGRAVGAIRARMRVCHLHDFGHARCGADVDGNKKMIRNEIGEENVLATPAAVVGAIKNVGDVAPWGTDIDSERLGR